MRLAVLFAAAGAALGQGPPAGPAGGIVVTGRIIDRQARQPLRGVRVALGQHIDEKSASYSDFRGNWKLPDAPPGMIEIRATKPGFQTVERGLEVPQSGPLSGVELEMSRLGVIAGRVLDEAGEPVVGARTMALRESAGEDGAYFAEAGEGYGDIASDDRGLYRVWGLRPGRYVIAAAPAGLPGISGQLRFEHALSFAPGVPRLSDAQLVEVGRGAVVEGVDVVLDAAGSTRVGGQLVEDAGGKCATCMIGVYQISGAGRISVARLIAPENKRFSLLGLAAGEYAAAASGSDPASGETVQGVTHFSVSPRQVSVVRVHAAPAQPLHVRVVLEDPPEEMVAGRKEWRTYLMLRQEARDQELYSMGEGMFGHVNGAGTEGHAELKTYPGPYRLMAYGLQNGYVDRVMADGRPLPSLVIAPQGAAVPAEVTVYVRFDLGAIVGSVLDWVPRAPRGVRGGLLPQPVVVYAKPVGPNGRFLQEQFAQVELDRSFRIQAAQGAYDVFALETQDDGMPYRDPRTAQALGEFRARVVVKPAQTTRVQLRVARAE